ncbi:MAG TPA: ethylbenzene dehydrogenase-related protein, partial [Anaerolineales bacterium]|nr:ethylbenzene dehydrogenase-related protein [Anaerolineales bacterium]
GVEVSTLIRNYNQVDDQYLDWTKVDTSTPENQAKTIEAGRHSDPKESGGYSNNETEDKTLPAFALPDNMPAPPYYIIDGEKVTFDDSKYKAADEVPGIIKSEIVGDRGDISAGWTYADGKWTIEFGRKLVTASEKYDVQFNDLVSTYFFGIAVFDNAQVRHAFEAGATPFVFKP